MTDEMWTIKRCLDWTNDYLARKGIERPRVSAEWLLTSVTGMSRIQLYTEFDRPLDSAGACPHARCCRSPREGRAVAVHHGGDRV